VYRDIKKGKPLFREIVNYNNQSTEMSFAGNVRETANACRSTYLSR